MSGRTPPAVDVVDADIAAAVDQWLAAGRRLASVVRLCRRPWEYATSAPLELVAAVTDDGCEYRFVLKHLGPRHVTGQVQRIKPSFVLDPRREIDVYRQLLAPSGLGATLVGSRIDPATDTYWLLLEYVGGSRLFEVGEPEAWTATARWLGALHARFASIDTVALRQSRGSSSATVSGTASGSIGHSGSSLLRTRQAPVMTARRCAGSPGGTTV